MVTQQDHLSALHPWLRDRVIAVLAEWRELARPGERIVISETTRSLALQQRYFARGSTRADGIRSYSQHQFAPALAVDCLVLRDGHVVGSIEDPAWRNYGLLGEAGGLSWGGRWPKLRDGPHLEVPLVERVKLVQAAVGAVPDGVWGRQTEAALKAAGVPLRAGKGWARMTPAAWAQLNP